MYILFYYNDIASYILMFLVLLFCSCRIYFLAIWGNNICIICISYDEVCFSYLSIHTSVRLFWCNTAYARFTALDAF